MRDIITYDEFILEQREESQEEMETEEELEATQGVDRYFSKWIRRRKDRAQSSQDAMRPKGSVNGEYGNSMQFGTKI